MRLSRMIPVAALLAAAAAAQERPKPELARVDGVIVDADSKLTLRRTHVILRPREGSQGAIGVDTDERGRFAFRDVPPGRYSLFAERDGYLPGTIARRAGVRLPEILSLQTAFPLTAVEIRMSKWATIGGRIRYDDGEPASSVLVQAWRERTYRGKHGYYVSTAVRSNDRGEYRIFGLAPGSYILAAVYDRVVQIPNLKEQPRLDASGLFVPPEGYTTTFFPNSTRLTDAAALKAGIGSEMNGIDIFLNPVRKLSIRGRVFDGISNAVVKSPALTLERVDATDSGSIPLQVPVLFNDNDTFELRGVPPGNYFLSAEGVSNLTRIAAHVPITVGNTDVDNVTVVMRGGAPWRLEVHSDLARGDRSVVVQFEPRSDRAVLLRENYREGMDVSLVPDEVYDVTVDNLPGDYYLKSVKVNNQEVRSLSGSPGKLADSMVLELDKNGGRVTGRVVTESGSDFLAGAGITLIPETGKLADYRESYSDEYAYFTLAGVAPGRYTLISWIDEPPCDIWRRTGCEAYGQAVTVESGSKIPVVLRYKAPPGN